MQVKNIVLLGATGSIGESTLRVVRTHPHCLHVTGAACYTQVEKLAHDLQGLCVKHIAIYDPKAYQKAREENLFPEATLYCGLEGLTTLATLPGVHTVVLATTGTLGLKPALAAVRAGKDIALANKEILVLAGSAITQAAREYGATIIPLDSEHSAIFQCLQGEDPKSIESIMLTASGGPFLNKAKEELAFITPEEALKHPNWSMGSKVTLDCATLANKGLELIEAHWLFDIPTQQLDAVIHPQSIIHSFVCFKDGSTLAQLSTPKMTFPIQYGLLYPQRLPKPEPSLDWSQIHRWEIRPINTAQFPCFTLAKEALLQGGTAPGTFNAANEVAVHAFLKHEIAFLDIPYIIECTLAKTPTVSTNSLDDLLQVDREARQIATSFIHNTLPIHV